MMMTTTTTSPPQNLIDWSGLPNDLLICVFQLLGVHSRICFRAVCRSWRAATDVVQAQYQQRATHMPPPWVVIPDDIGCSKSFTLLSIPSQQVLSWTPPGGAGLRCVGSNGGWLAGAYIDVDRMVRISLINPLTNARVEVPAIGRVSFMPHKERHKFQVERVLSAAVQKVAFSPNPTDKSFAVAVIGRVSPVAGPTGIVFTRAGCEGWFAYDKLSDDPNSRYPSARMDVAYHDGKFYYMGMFAVVWVVDMAAPSPSAALLARFEATIPGRVHGGRKCSYYFAFSSDGALHVVSSRTTGQSVSSLNMFVERYSSQEGSSPWTSSIRLHGQAFLVGDFNQTLCVPVDGGDCAWMRPDSVYFTGIPLCSSLRAKYYRGVRGGVVWMFNLATGYTERPTYPQKTRWRRLDFSRPDLLAEEAWNRLRLDWSKAIWFMPSKR